MPPRLPAAELVDEVLALAATSSPEQASEQLAERGVKVSYRTIYTWRDRRAADPAWPNVAGKAAQKPPSDRPPPSPRPEKPAPPPGPDIALVRRILGARDPSALAELDAGLVEAARGEDALAAWLSRPLPTPEDDDAIDPLEACSRALSVATAHLEHVPPLHARAASLSTAVANLAARVEKIAAGRPQAPTADEVTERIRARADEARERIFEHAKKAQKKLLAERSALGVWAEQNLGPLLAAELGRRVDRMLSGEDA